MANEDEQTKAEKTAKEPRHADAKAAKTAINDARRSLDSARRSLTYGTASGQLVTEAITLIVEAQVAVSKALDAARNVDRNADGG